MAKLDAEFASAAAAYGADPTNISLMQKMMDIGHARGKLADTEDGIRARKEPCEFGNRESPFGH